MFHIFNFNDFHKYVRKSSNFLLENTKNISALDINRNFADIDF